MLDIINCKIDKVVAHQIGNKTNDEALILSNSILATDDERLDELLSKYFLHPFSKIEEFYSFTFSNEDFKLNPLYQFAGNIFNEKEDFVQTSISIAKQLFETSLHPQIKSGDLFIAEFSDIRMGEKSMKAIGIFKSENRQSFLKLNQNSGDLQLNYYDGINIEKLDKGCLIMDTESDEGYRVCMIDKTSKTSEARFWKEGFLNLKPLSDGFHNTSDFMGIAKQFVNNQLGEDFEVTKADKIDLLNRSVEYFKTKEDFDKTEFEEAVFADTEVIDSFRKFDQGYREEHEMESADSFEISGQAVKQQARTFKSVLKLDKNFHIYIHGNKELIEKGVDDNGRKFYKVYYQEEK